MLWKRWAIIGTFSTMGIMLGPDKPNSFAKAPLWRWKCENDWHREDQNLDKDLLR